MIHYNFDTKILSEYFSQLFFQDNFHISKTKLNNLLIMAKLTLSIPDIIPYYNELLEKEVNLVEYATIMRRKHSPFFFPPTSMPLRWKPSNNNTKPLGFVFCDNEEMNEVANDFVFQLYLRFRWVNLYDAVKPKLTKEEIMKKDYEKRSVAFSFIKNYDLSKKVASEIPENCTYINPLTLFD